MTSRSIGIDVGGTFLKAVAVEGSAVVHEEATEVPAAGVLEVVTATAGRLVEEFVADAVGVGLAGLVRWPEGELVWGPHATERSVPYRRELSERLQRDVVVDNDANLAAYAEAVAGAGLSHRVVLAVILGTGIGGGLVIDGQIFRGASFAGEIGHMAVDRSGRLCACGQRGCWETTVSGPLLEQVAEGVAKRYPQGVVARLAGPGPVGAAHLSAAADRADTVAREALEEPGRWLGRGVVNLVAMLDPDVVVVGGAVIGAGEHLLGPARDEIASRLSGAENRPAVRLVAARFGGLAGAVGAALLASAQTAGRAESAER